MWLWWTVCYAALWIGIARMAHAHAKQYAFRAVQAAIGRQYRCGGACAEEHGLRRLAPGRSRRVESALGGRDGRPRRRPPRLPEALSRSRVIAYVLLRLGTPHHPPARLSKHDPPPP